MEPIEEHSLGANGRERLNAGELQRECRTLVRAHANRSRIAAPLDRREAPVVERFRSDLSDGVLAHAIPSNLAAV